MTVRQAESPARRRAVQADRRVAGAILRGAAGSRVMAGAQGKGEAGTTDPRATSATHREMASISADFSVASVARLAGTDGVGLRCEASPTHCSRATGPGAWSSRGFASPQPAAAAPGPGRREPGATPARPVARHLLRPRGPMAQRQARGSGRGSHQEATAGHPLPGYCYPLVAGVEDGDWQA